MGAADLSIAAVSTPKVRHPKAPVVKEVRAKRGPYTPALQASTLFTPGQPVRLKDEALDKVRFGVGGHQQAEGAAYGTVVGFSRTKPSRVYVRVTGRKQGRLFPARMWEAVAELPTTPMVAVATAS